MAHGKYNAGYEEIINLYQCWKHRKFIQDKEVFQCIYLQKKQIDHYQYLISVGQFVPYTIKQLKRRLKDFEFEWSERAKK